MCSDSAAHFLDTHPQISGIIDVNPVDLTPWPNNPRKHSVKQKAKLKASIKRFNFTTTVTTDEHGVILSGHCRVEVAIELGLKTVPTRVISGMSEQEKRALVLADNKLGDLSTWDESKLQAELKILLQQEIEIELSGFSTSEVDAIIGDPDGVSAPDSGDVQPEDVIEEVIFRPGDIWQLGTHRLICGNALDGATYNALMNDEQAQLVIADAPFNVPISGHVCGKGKNQHKEFAMASGEMTPGEFTEFLNAAFKLARQYSRDGAIHYYFMDWRHIREMLDAAEPVFGPLRQLIPWVKDNAGMGPAAGARHVTG